MRDKGVKVKEWWFRTKCKNLMEEMHPEADFKMSDQWFSRFKSRFGISLRRPTNAAQRPPDTLQSSIQQFHRYIRQTATNKENDLLGIQTPLEFCY